MTVRGIFVLLLCGLCVSAAFAKPGVVKLKNGTVYEGDVDDSDVDTVVVTSPTKIKTPIARTLVQAITYPGSFDEQYKDRMAKLDAKDVDGRLVLAEDAFKAGRYALARDAAESARQIDSNNAKAVELIERSQAQMRLERTKQQSTVAGSTTHAATTPTTQGDKRLVSPAEINQIRLGEMRPEDANVRVRFERDVKKRFINYKGLQPNAFNNVPIGDQVQMILMDGTPEMKRDVMIQNDPPAMFAYRRTIQPFVIANCATSGCHGGANTKSLSLITPPESDAATYTNFYILQKYTKAVKQTGDSVFARGDLRMIDRAHPEQSLLLQYSLPGSISEFDHPDVPGYRSPMRGVADPKYRLILDWIATSLKPVDPDYGFDFPVQGSTSTPTSQPATAPATAPQTDAKPDVKPKPATRPAVAPRPAPPRAAGPTPARPALPSPAR